jgi:hypothetical protein
MEWGLLLRQPHRGLLHCSAQFKDRANCRIAAETCIGIDKSWPYARWRDAAPQLKD